jgi:ferric-dicitrate binding protein FerR (iron transport regulator)
VDKNIYHIASDYFSGRISESDLSSLQSWLAESPDNKALLNELKKVWELTGELSFELKPNVDAEWNRFLVEKERKNIKNVRTILKQVEFRKILKIAAVVIPALIIFSVVLINITGKDKSSELISIHTNNEKKECILADGTKVLINANSHFEYPLEFSDNKRVVKLNGEAFFEVVKEKSPFKIITEKTQVIVVGTEFNIRAFGQEKSTEVFVKKGIVIFEELKSNKNTTLLAGEKGIYNEQTKELSKEKITDFNAIGWKEGKLNFQDTPLSDIETILTRYFNVKVQVAPSLKQCKFTGEFTEARLDDILKVISISLGSTYQKRNDTVYIEGKGCKD